MTKMLAEVDMQIEKLFICFIFLDMLHVIDVCQGRQDTPAKLFTLVGYPELTSYLLNIG